MKTGYHRPSCWTACAVLISVVAGCGGSSECTEDCVPDGILQFGSAAEDLVESVRVDGDGSMVVAGTTHGDLDSGESSDDYDAFVRRYDADGVEQWTDHFGGDGDDRVHAMTVGGDGSIVVAGFTDGDLGGDGSAGSYDAFVRKYSPAGVVEWTEQLGSAGFDYAHSVSVADDGSVVIAGQTAGDLDGNGNAGGDDAFVAKYSAAGVEQWIAQLGTAGADRAYSVAVDGVGNAVVVGNTEGDLGGTGSAGSTDVFVRKYDAEGVEQWTMQFGTASDDRSRSVSVGSDGSIYVAGYTAGDLGGEGNAGGEDAYVRTYSAEGVMQWTHQFGTEGEDRAHEVRAHNESVLVAGSVVGDLAGEGHVGGEDVFVRELSSSGVEQRTVQVGTPNDDRARTLSAGSDRVVVAGNTDGDLGGDGNAGDTDGFIWVLLEPW